MMERVIQNLVDNAIKSTPEGGNIQVYLAVENKVLIFNIANEGTPLTEDLLEWINDASTESGLLHKRPAHTGLGLVIVKKIVALHHFSLSAKTDTATGNLFSIRMPVYR
jgi:K+-sensing histidine kinase KdpD